jgi:hypothetical protein
VRWAEEKAAENVPPPEVKQIVAADSVKAACEEHPLCVIAFLPNILDCQVSYPYRPPFLISAVRKLNLHTLPRKNSFN